MPDGPLIADCRDCWWTSVWDREEGGPDEHPHAERFEHVLEYQALGDRLDWPSLPSDLVGGLS